MSSLHAKDTGMSTVKTVKFDGNNFQWWKVQIKALLEGEGLWPGIKFKNEEDFMQHFEEQLLTDKSAMETRLGEAKLTATDTEDGAEEGDQSDLMQLRKERREFAQEILLARRRYTRMREKAYSVLVLAMDQSTSHLIMNCESGNAHEVWEHLLQHFQRKTLASKLALKQAFHS